MEEKNKEVFRGFDDDILYDEDFEEETEEETEDKDVGSPESDEETKESTTDSTETDTNAKGEEEVEEEDKKAEDEKSKEAKRNAEFAKRRRAKEEQDKKEREAKEAEIREKAKVEAELGILKKNPYTDEPIKDAQDLEIYKIMKGIEDEGGDPVNDLPKKIAEINRARFAKDQEEKSKAKARQTKIKEETDELINTYPNLDLAKLSEDKEFLDLCEKKGDRWTMTEIYEHLETKRERSKNKEIEENKKKEVKEKATKMSKTPSSNADGNLPSPDDYLNMSDEEFLEKTKDSRDFF